MCSSSGVSLLTGNRERGASPPSRTETTASLWQATRRLAHPESNSPSLKSQPLLPTYIFPPTYLPILSWQISMPEEGYRPLLPIHSQTAYRFLRALSTDSFVPMRWLFAWRYLPFALAEGICALRSGKCSRSGRVSGPSGELGPECERIGTAWAHAGLVLPEAPRRSSKFFTKG